MPGWLKVRRMVAMSAVALAWCSLAADDNTPGYVKVEWSLETGEKWEVKGLADREAGRPMATNTIFAICSNTKPVTSVLALTFVEEGMLNLDDPVSKYFPEFADIRFNGKCRGAKKEGDRPEHPILLRHLITHLSGLCFSARTPQAGGHILRRQPLQPPARGERSQVLHLRRRLQRARRAADARPSCGDQAEDRRGAPFPDRRRRRERRPLTSLANHRRIMLQ